MLPPPPPPTPTPNTYHRFVHIMDMHTHTHTHISGRAESESEVSGVRGKRWRERDSRNVAASVVETLILPLGCSFNPKQWWKAIFYTMPCHAASIYSE